MAAAASSGRACKVPPNVVKGLAEELPEITKFKTYARGLGGHYDSDLVR